MEQKIKNLA